MDDLTSHFINIHALLVDAAIEIPVLGLSLPILEVMHAILINYTYRSLLKEHHTRIGWYQGLLATIVMCAGGGSTVCILRGEPLRILKSNRFWGIYGTTYWLMFSNSYFFQFLEYLFAIPLVEQLFTVADGILRNMSVVNNGVDGVAASMGDDKWVAKILCGTLAGCGGGLWIDAFKLTSAQWSFSTPRLLHTASIDMKASFVTAIFYTIMSTPELSEAIGLPVLKPEAAQVWSAVILTTGLLYRTMVSKMEKTAAPSPKVLDEKKDN